MPPLSPEQDYNKNEAENSHDLEYEQYLDVERGDVDLGASDPGNQPSQQNTTSQQQSTASQTQSPAPDPVQLFQNMISAGFTPTKAQISNASSYLNGPHDSSNTWFAIFLQRLLKQHKNKGRKK